MYNMKILILILILGVATPSRDKAKDETKGVRFNVHLINIG